MTGSTCHRAQPDRGAPHGADGGRRARPSAYGEQRALADISFAVNAGEVLGLIGPNGAGKTTLLEAIAGLLPADGGRILWRGTSLALPQPPRVHVLPAGRAAPVGRAIRCSA